MGKDKKESKKNKMHHKRKDRKHKRERSTKEHLLRKEKDQKEKLTKIEEESRYFIDDFQLKKLLKVLRELIEYKAEVIEEVPEVFEMLDNGNEVEITDLEDGMVREGLEKIFSIFSSQIERSEDRDGRFVYQKVAKKSLKEQIVNYFQKAKTAPNADHISDIIGEKLHSGLITELRPTEKIQSTEKYAKETRPRTQELGIGSRPKSLMEIHLEKHSGSNKLGSEKYIYGHKSLQKRFGQGKFSN